MGVAPQLGLDAIREALLAEAADEAEHVVEQAEDWAAAQVASAEEQARAFIGTARAEGERAAAREAAAEIAHARRRARSLVLEAQRAVYDDVRREAQAAAQELRSRPDYPDLVARLAAHAREQLGPDAEVELDPPAGGVVARAGNRLLDLTLPVLVDRCLARHASEVESLWT